MEGASCDDWKITPADDPVIFIDSDPNLADLTWARQTVPKVPEINEKILDLKLPVRASGLVCCTRSMIAF